MNNTIIELRQENTNSNVAVDNQLNQINGDYRTSFEPITINPNDVVAIKSAFIDSLNSSSDKVFVPESGNVKGQCQIEIDSGYYTVDWGQTYDSLFPNKLFNVNNGDHPDSRPYILCEDHTPDDTNDSVLLTEFRIPVVNISKTDMKNSNQSFQATINFQYPSGKQQQIYIHLFFDRMPLDAYLKYDDTTAPNKAESAYILVNEELQKKYPQAWEGTLELMPITIKRGTTGDLSFDKLGNAFVRAPFTTIGMITLDVNNDSVFAPYTRKTTFSIDSGSYDPQELAILLSQKMSSIDLSGVNNNPLNTVNNNFMKTTKQLAQELNKTPLKFTRDDGLDIMTINTQGTNLNYYVGASQIAIGYDEELRKFSIEQAHSSLYDSFYTPNTDDSGTGQKQIRLLNSLNGTKSVANKNTGVFFTRLEPENLWYDVMGFSRKTLLTQIENKRTIPSIGADTNVLLSPVTLIDGVNITGDSSGIDSVISKSNTNPPDDGSATIDEFRSFDVAPSSGNNSDIFTNVNQTISIFSSKLSQESKQKEPYFQIEIDNFNQEMLGKDNKTNKIQAILSRYYSDDAFTFSYNEGSTPYIHKSNQPLYLSSLRVRILNPDGTVDTSLGPRNTIFLEIQRALQE